MPDSSPGKKIALVAIIVAVATCLVIVIAANLLPRDDEEIPEAAYDFKVFFGSHIDSLSVAAMIADYEKETGLKVEPVYYENLPAETAYLERLLDGDDPVAAFVVAEGPTYEEILDGGYILNLEDSGNSFSGRLTGGDRILWTVKGRGFVAKQSVLAELFSLSPDEAYIAVAAIRDASYEEWADFIIKLENYLDTGVPELFTLAGHVFFFPEEKSSAIAEATGAFAMAGSDEKIMGDYTAAPLFGSGEAARLLGLKEAMPEQAALAFDQVVSAYIEGLDMMTSHLAGYYAPGIRGDSFITSSMYGVDKASLIFANGKSVFILGDEALQSTITRAGGEVKEELLTLPIKYPYAANGLDEAGRNRMIVGGPSEYLCINANADEEKRKQGIDFVEWLCSDRSAEKDSMQRSLRGYAMEGLVMGDPTVAPAPLPDEEASEGIEAVAEQADVFFVSAFHRDDGISAWFADAVWLAEDKDALKARLASIWHDG
ncbi:MAG: extracellular solute-binding protein [Clostridiales Family XIII bacterium]|jgi:hypothetical protein|nr:extracellular solute-binding protein [Clostridiales Family XIII bacterium]